MRKWLWLISVLFLGGCLAPVWVVERLEELKPRPCTRPWDFRDGKVVYDDELDREIRLPNGEIYVVPATKNHDGTPIKYE